MTDESAHEETQGPLIQWDINKAAIAKVAEELKDIDPYKDLKGAKEAKQKLVKMRTKLGDAHRETKAEALAFGRKVDAKKNEYMALIREIEDPISDDLTKIKNAALVKEEVRVAKIMAEIERIQAYSLDRHSLTLEELEARLSDLRDQVLNLVLLEEYAEDAQLATDEADLKLRLAIDREKADITESEEKERIEAENKELRDKLAKSEAEQGERDAEAQKLADKRADEAQAAQKKIDDDRQAELDEQAEANRIEAERLAEEEAERQRVVDEEAAALFDANEKQKAEEMAALQAPDVDKLTKYAEAIDHLIGLRPVMGSTAGNSALLDTVGRLVDTHTVITNHIEEMK